MTCGCSAGRKQQFKACPGVLPGLEMQEALRSPVPKRRWVLFMFRHPIQNRFDESANDPVESWAYSARSEGLEPPTF
jgi:hypothetical protein